jgi:hypothetical protein
MNNPYFFEMLHEDGPIKRHAIASRVRMRRFKEDEDTESRAIELVIDIARKYLALSGTETCKLEREFLASNENYGDDGDLIMYVIDNYERIEHRRIKLMFYYAFNLLAMSNAFP